MHCRSILTFLFFFAACAPSKKQTKIIIDGQSVPLQETLACMTNIPDAPIGFKAIKIIQDQTESDDRRNVKIVYQATSKNKKIDVLFLQKEYQADMELLGWDFMSQFQDDQELLLLFARPKNVWCQVCIKEGAAQIALTLLYKN